MKYRTAVLATYNTIGTILYLRDIGHQSLQPNTRRIVVSRLLVDHWMMSIDCGNPFYPANVRKIKKVTHSFCRCSRRLFPWESLQVMGIHC